MAEGVTYADLRFAKGRPPGDSPREGGRAGGPPDGLSLAPRLPPPPACLPAAECTDGEGELTYENFPAGARPRQTAGPGPDPDPQPPGAVGGRVWSWVPLALLGACLFLLATCLGLGLRYWQVSRELEGASRRHRAESGALAQRLGSQEENLTRTLRLLSQAQDELSDTSLALWESWEAGNRTRWQLEGERKQWRLAQSRLQEEKAQAARQLEEAKEVLSHVASCGQTDCCPLGWKPFSQKCLWISSAWKTWEGSRQDCGKNEAQLLILKPWNAGTFWDAAVTTNLRSMEFWIGLRWARDDWHWVDGTRYTGTEKPSSGWSSAYCVKMSRGALKQETCSSSQRYICEKAATPFSTP